MAFHFFNMSRLLQFCELTTITNNEKIDVSFRRSTRSGAVKYFYKVCFVLISASHIFFFQKQQKMEEELLQNESLVYSQRKTLLIGAEKDLAFYRNEDKM